MKNLKNAFLKFLSAFLVFFLFANQNTQAAEVHIFLPGIQYRYENDKDQSISNRRYQNFNLAGIIFSDYLIGAEFNEFKQQTSSGSISITEKFQEFNLYAGYFVYSVKLNDEYKIFFDLGPVGYIGQSRSTVETNVGSLSQQSIGEDNLTVALGVQATLRIAFLILQPEMRYAYSRSSQPNYVPAFGGRLGFRIGF
jgi:hypothetical protein